VTFVSVFAVFVLPALIVHARVRCVCRALTGLQIRGRSAAGRRARLAPGAEAHAGRAPDGAAARAAAAGRRRGLAIAARLAKQPHDLAAALTGLLCDPGCAAAACRGFRGSMLAGVRGCQAS
jgi:hypothetical protein